MNNKRFLSEVEDQFRLICVGLSGGRPPTPQERGRLEGFMRAGVVLGATTNEELQQLMEDIHFGVFGETIEARKARRQTQFNEDTIDYGQFESPAIHRKTF